MKTLRELDKKLEKLKRESTAARKTWHAAHAAVEDLYFDIKARRFRNIKEGDRIEHTSMGRGIVTEIKIRYDRILIDFDRGGHKELLMSFARRRLRKLTKKDLRA